MCRACLILSVSLFGLLRILSYVTEPLLSDQELHQIVGEPARVRAAAQDAQALKVVTWNIQWGVQFDRILTTLRALDADIVLLQEVDMFCRRSGRRDIARALADGLAMNWVCAGEFQEIGESRSGVAALTGQAVLSKYSIEAPAVIQFAAQAMVRWRLNPLQPRRGGRMALRVRSAGVLIYNAHLESWGNDSLRRKQLEEILADQAGSAHAGTPVIVAGDFNNLPAIRSSLLGRLTAAEFTDGLGADNGRRTSIRHSHPIDWIFLKNLKRRDGRVADSGAASDHFPVVAVFVR